MTTRPLPPHVEPMLARIGAPFASPQHLFEIKWDGVRAMAYVERGAWRMHGRRRRDLAGRYPELAFLAGLPEGTLLDGELVVLQPDGKPDFRGILARENGTAERAAQQAKKLPVVFVVFDLLYAGGESLMAAPLHVRREALLGLVAAAGHPRLVASHGVVGDGLSLFAAVKEQGLEGIVAKRLDAPYRPGERGDAWQKIKAVQQVHCLVLGYEPDGERDFKSLIVATDVGGELRCVGKVGSGLDDQERARLRQMLFAARADRPLIDPGMPGRWIAPGLYCTVNFLEWTASGSLRAPVFVALVDEADA
ncbi:MAG: DNA ligase [Planctomycetes bacterium]|nr:DNA ligase [Planctomycetota bacterium]